MAWEWSHTVEAYRDAEMNLADLDPVTLREIYAEWKALSDREEYAGGFDQITYETELWIAQELPATYLAEFIWERASELATCDSGGFNAWMCPFGCGCHTVPFDRENLERGNR